MRWILALLLLASCGRGADAIDWLRMKDQSEMKAMPYAETPYLPDGRVMRVPPRGTVPRERLEADRAPPPIDAALLARGRERFDITCATCHGVLGDGVSEVARNMRLRKPPSLHEPRIRAYPPEKLIQIMTLGFGLMPSYAWSLPPRDRYAVAAYVRALQLSQSVRLADLPPPLRAEAQRQMEAVR
jgi:mono/diheme cytochrome c family protein